MEDWDSVVRQHGPLVWKTAYRILSREADAADCFQEAFVSALQVARRQSVRNWPGLLQKLATARALDLLRKRLRENRRRLPKTDWDRVSSGGPDPLDDLQAVDLDERLRAALTTLPAQQSEVFCLRHLNDLSYEQIAAELGMTLDSVGVTLHRARTRLRELLTHQCGDAGRPEVHHAQ